MPFCDKSDYTDTAREKKLIISLFRYKNELKQLFDFIQEEKWAIKQILKIFK